MSDPLQDTVDLKPADAFADKFFASPGTPLSISFGAATHRGNVRPKNEDHFAVIERCRSTRLLLSNLEPDGTSLPDDMNWGMVVADGIGGARSGDLASRLAVRTMLDLSLHATSWVMKLTDLEAQQIRERVKAYVDRIQSTLLEYGQAEPALAGMGTTWTSAHFMPPHAVIVHLGDSRAYLFRDGELEQITRDETMAQAFIDTGMEPESVKKFGHVLLNSFGGDSEQVSSQIYQVPFEAGDQLLLCSDGLSDMVSDEEIAAELRRHQEPQAACDALITLALANGGRDNVTVVLASAAPA